MVSVALLGCFLLGHKSYAFLTLQGNRSLCPDRIFIFAEVVLLINKDVIVCKFNPLSAHHNLVSHRSRPIYSLSHPLSSARHARSSKQTPQPYSDLPLPPPCRFDLFTRPRPFNLQESIGWTGSDLGYCLGWLEWERKIRITECRKFSEIEMWQ